MKHNPSSTIYQIQIILDRKAIKNNKNLDKFTSLAESKPASCD